MHEYCAVMFIVGLKMMITDEEIKTVTNDFSNLIGRGGFGSVYRGRYKHVEVAVKILSKVITG